MRKRIFLLIIILLLIQSAVCFADYPAFTLKLSPSFNLPMGERSEAFGMGGGGNLTGNVNMPFLPPFLLGVDLGYSFTPMKIPADVKSAELFSLSFISLGGVLGLNFELLPWLFLGFYGKGGYFYTFFNDDPSTGGGVFS